MVQDSFAISPPWCSFFKPTVSNQPLPFTGPRFVDGLQVTSHIYMGPPQHKGELANHAQALETSQQSPEPAHNPRHAAQPHHPPCAGFFHPALSTRRLLLLAVAVGASQRQTVAVGPAHHLRFTLGSLALDLLSV